MPTSKGLKKLSGSCRITFQEIAFAIKAAERFGTCPIRRYGGNPLRAIISRFQG
jgi:hypothetical protein